MSWAKDFFDENFATFFLDNHPNTKADIEFINSVINLNDKATVLDQGCGIGRLSQEIIKSGASVIGVDIVDDYIKTAQKENPDGIFVCAPAETFVSKNKCDLVINWWTSFGYGKTETDDQKVLQSAYDSLKEGGHYMLEIPNANYCRSAYSSDKKNRHENTINDIKITWDGWLSKDKNKIFKSWTYEKEDGETGTKLGGGINLYSAEKIQTMLEKCGFKIVRILGGTDFSDFTSDSHRCIIVAQRPEGKFFLNELPKGIQSLHQSIYNGKVYKLPPCKVSHTLINHLTEKIEYIFGPETRTLQNLGAHEDSLRQLAPLKSDIKKDKEYHIIMRALLMEMGITPSEYAIDYPRLRVNIPSGHTNDGAKAAYSAHRDTWYCNPQSQINFWIPLYDCTEKQSFAFYPDYFNQPVKNNSADFDYNSWISGGFPEAKENLSNPISFSAKAGEIILFSAAHLHMGLPHDEKTVRYSLDFRIVHIKDFENNIGAPNVDNDSLPFAMPDYLASGI